MISPPHFTHPNAEYMAESLKNVLGEWSALSVLIHLVVYEEIIAYPEMRRFIYNENPVFDEKTYKNEENKLLTEKDFLIVLKRFQEIRDKQIDLLHSCSNETLNKEIKNTIWGPQHLNFVINKTIQHTMSHGSKLYAKLIFWDNYWKRLEQS